MKYRLILQLAGTWKDLLSEIYSMLIRARPFGGVDFDASTYSRTVLDRARWYQQQDDLTPEQRASLFVSLFRDSDRLQVRQWLEREQPELPNGITLEAEIQQELSAWFDVTQMSRLLQNLLDNAARYGRENGHIWVTLRREDDGIALSVRDDGIGIAQDQQTRIWQRFYQVDPARSGSSGSGLGLTMVQQIAALHGGTVTLESREGAGSCFTFRFPGSRPPS